MTRNEAKKHFSYMYEDGFCKDDLMVGLDQIYNDHEAQLKAKDEEIHYLKTQMTGWSMMFDEPQDAKARSIVAMLFWEWRKHNRMYELTKFGSYLAITHLNNATLSKLIFQQAYKMLKDIK